MCAKHYTNLLKADFNALPGNANISGRKASLFHKVNVGTGGKREGATEKELGDDDTVEFTDGSNPGPLVLKQFYTLMILKQTLY